MLVVRRTASMKAKAAARGIPTSTQAFCCSYYRGRTGEIDQRRPSASKAPGASSRRLGAVASVGPVFNLSSGTTAGDAPRATATAMGRARNKSTAALMEENDNDFERGTMVDRGAGGGDSASLTSFRLTGERG